MNLLSAYKASLCPEKSKEGKAFLQIFEYVITLSEFEEQKKLYHHLRFSRYRHTVSVAFLTYIKTKEKGLDFMSATEAALFHDLYFYDWKKNGKRPKNHLSSHPKSALDNAMKIKSLSEKEQNIILSHMYPIGGIRPNSREAWTVCIFDKVCTVFECILSLFTNRYSVEKIKE